MGMLLHRHNIEVQAVEKPLVSSKKVSVEKEDSDKSITKKDLFGLSKKQLIDVAKENGIDVVETDKANDIKKTIIEKLGL